jgi:hypothetical protein
MYSCQFRTRSHVTGRLPSQGLTEGG